MRYVLDSHTHTLASGHAYNTIYEMAHAAAKKGLHLLGITEHAMKMPGTCHEFYFMNLRVNPKNLFGVEMLYGTEANILDYDGRLDMEPWLLKKMDVVVASLHTPCIPAGTCEENTRAVLGAIANPYVNILGHPDDGRYPLDYEKVVLAAKAHHVLIELNNSSLDSAGARENAWEMNRILLPLCKRYEVPIILDSDAHCASDVGNHSLSDQILRELDFPENLIVNRSVEEFRKFLK